MGQKATDSQKNGCETQKDEAAAENEHYSALLGMAFPSTT